MRWRWISVLQMEAYSSFSGIAGCSMMLPPPANEIKTSRSMLFSINPEPVPSWQSSLKDNPMRPQACSHERSGRGPSPWSSSHAMCLAAVHVSQGGPVSPNAIACPWARAIAWVRLVPSRILPSWGWMAVSIEREITLYSGSKTGANVSIQWWQSSARRLPESMCSTNNVGFSWYPITTGTAEASGQVKTGGVTGRKSNAWSRYPWEKGSRVTLCLESVVTTGGSLKAASGSRARSSLSKAF